MDKCSIIFRTSYFRVISLKSWYKLAVDNGISESFKDISNKPVWRHESQSAIICRINTCRICNRIDLTCTLRVKDSIENKNNWWDYVLSWPDFYGFTHWLIFSSRRQYLLLSLTYHYCFIHSGWTDDQHDGDVWRLFRLFAYWLHC